MDKLEKVEEKLNKVQKKIDQNTLAMEMLKELKRSGQRKFIIIIILIIALIGTNISWFIYESQFEEVSDIEQTTIDAGENGTATYLENSESGDIIYGENNKNKNN